MNNIDYNDWLNDLALTVVLFPVAVFLLVMFGAYRLEVLLKRVCDGKSPEHKRSGLHHAASQGARQ